MTIPLNSKVMSNTEKILSQESSTVQLSNLRNQPRTVLYSLFLHCLPLYSRPPSPRLRF